MLSVLMILLILVSIFMIAIVLLQPGKGDLSATFGGIGSQMGSVFGMQKTANILATVTKVAAIVILVLTIGANKFFVHSAASTQEPQKIVTEGQKPSATVPASAQQPQQGGNAPQQGK